MREVEVGIRRLCDADAERGRYLGVAGSGVAMIIIQLNVALILQMSRVDAFILIDLLEERFGLLFEQGWGVPTLLVTGFAGSMSFVALSGSSQRVLSWLAGCLPIAVFFTVIARTVFGSTLVPCRVVVGRCACGADECRARFISWGVMRTKGFEAWEKDTRPLAAHDLVSGPVVDNGLLVPVLLLPPETACGRIGSNRGTPPNRLGRH